jgi:hypothetical protein
VSMVILPYGEQGTDGAGSARHGSRMYFLLLLGKNNNDGDPGDELFILASNAPHCSNKG